MSINRKNKCAALVLRVLAPGECSAKELHSFARLVRQGGQVAAAGLKDLIASAALLGFAWSAGTLVGVAALKIPRPAYRQKVFTNAGVAAHALRFPLEFGWVCVAPQFRGLGIAKTLLNQLLAKSSDGAIFATTSADNQFMQKILQKADFELIGQPYPSHRTNGSNCLWVRPSHSA